MIQECSIPFSASYTHLEQQWAFGPSFWSGGNSSRSVGVATLVRGRSFTVDSVTELEGGRALVVDGSWAGEPVRLINVYAPSDVGERRELFQRLRPQLVTSRTIMMGGDFNCILDSGGRCGTRAKEGWLDDGAKLLAEMVGEASRTNVIGSMGADARNFTWSRPDGSVRSRIDFVFTSRSVRIRQHSMVTVHFSDHRAIRFQGELTGKFLTGPGTWKLNSSLLGREDVQEELRRTYSEWQDMKDTFQSVGEWWEWVKGRIQDFFKNVGRKAARGRKREFSRVQQQLQELHDLQLRGWDVMNPLEAVKKELSEHFHEESRRIIFRSKVENLEKGEKCNSFFFKKIHSAHTPLVQLRNREGILCDTKEDIRKAVTDFYGDLYSEKMSDGDQAERFLAGIPRKDSTPAWEVLNAPLTLEELHIAVKSFKSGKTPGSDGLPIEFYTSQWDLVGPDLLELYEEMEQEGVMPHTLREGTIALLYKHKGERCDLKNWRPISLLNVDYKILAKTMVNRLKSAMGELVHPDQTCGVPGRRVADSLALIRDTIQYITDRNIHAALVCLDQEKAFDRVSHEFMERVLQGFGLGERFCNYVRIMYTDIFSSVMVNGWKTDPFPIRSGVRQGCPLSPSLFVLVIELLAEYIRKNPNIRGIPTPGDAKKEVKCSLYMDDVTLFCTDGKSVQSLLEACKDFGKASGAKINVDKSQAKLFGRWDLCNEPLPFPIEAGLVKILGIWFGGPGAAAKSWNERLAKVKQKLGFWSLRHLSIEGKALVLRNDALPVLQYLTQAWPLLANVARAVNSMVFHFVWHSKMDRVKRTVMHKEHRKGGKAVPDIPTILRAFFVCGCVRITLTNENKDHSAYKVFRFFLLPVWRRLGWDKWENATMFNWDLPWYYKEIEKFVVEFGLKCVTPSLWKPRTIHRLIRSMDTTEPVSDLPPATATRVWENVSSPSLTNRHKDIAWMAVKGGLPVRSFMHSRGLCPHRECQRGCPAEEPTYHLFWACPFAQRLRGALKQEMEAHIPYPNITHHSVLYGLFPKTHSVEAIQGCWRILCCVKDILLYARTRLVTNGEVVSREACRRMVLNLLRDYTDKDNKEGEKEEEL
ncbi:hypothetical protein NDU88_007931 [Pleurodeles waltl]|uniref:Reverse transcriptase domain-containing protein n=1 Tax=Pleurodeles waltl TaxID=8319 RepID=A0AAV7STW4_PLEWA|nr:hypothetical protein NDU88_007931 [Pleurodeles waltl]